MTSLSPFDIERMLIGAILVYGNDAAKYVLPQLSHDKYLFSKEGRLDGAKDHLRLWQAITLTYAARESLTLPNIMLRLEGNQDYLFYLKSLETALPGYYSVRDYDPRLIMRLAEAVDKAGVMYRSAVRSTKVSNILESPERFAKEVAAVSDVTNWLNEYVSDLSSVATSQAEGYKHISQAVDETIEVVERTQRGENLTILPVGMPSLTMNGLLATGTLVVLQAGSNTGKSVVSNVALLGTAIGLHNAGIKGCVAMNSLEEDQDYFTMKLAAVLAEVDLFKFSTLGQPLTPGKYDRFMSALDYVRTLPIYLDTTHLLSASDVELRAGGLHASERGPIWLQVVDYIELLNLSDEDKDNKEQALDAVIHKIFRMTRQMGLCAVVLSQSTYGTGGTGKFRIAGAEGTRYSKALYHACDILLEWWNPIEMKNQGFDFVVPTSLNEHQPWLMNEKRRKGPKFAPIPFGWQPEYQRFFDMELNAGGDERIRLFNHDIPDFTQIYSMQSAGF